MPAAESELRGAAEIQTAQGGKLLGEFAHVEPIIGMAEPYHYRNKVQAAFATARNGKIISGVYQSGTHSIVCVDSCLTEDRKADEIIVSIRNMLKVSEYSRMTSEAAAVHFVMSSSSADSRQIR